MLALLLTLQCFLFTTSTLKLPPFQYCRKSDPKLENCLIESIQNAVVYLADGYRPFKVPPLADLKIESMVLPSGSGPVGIVQHYKNVSLTGITDGLKVTKASVDFDKLLMKIENVCPNVTLTGKYSVEGRILTFTLGGQGNFTMSNENLNVTHKIRLELVAREGKEYLKVIDYKVKLSPEKIYFHFWNVSNINKAFDDEINAVLNENWKVVYSDAVDGYEDVYGTIFTDLASKFFTNIPFNELFLE